MLLLYNKLKSNVSYFYAIIKIDIYICIYIYYFDSSFDRSQLSILDFIIDSGFFNVETLDSNSL